jgi:hypothetical protein
MGQLVRQYASLPLGGTDASVVAVAERVKTLRVATLDRTSPRSGGEFGLGTGGLRQRGDGMRRRPLGGQHRAAAGALGSVVSRTVRHRTAAVTPGPPVR